MANKCYYCHSQIKKGGNLKKVGDRYYHSSCWTEQYRVNQFIRMPKPELYFRKGEEGHEGFCQVIKAMEVSY